MTAKTNGKPCRVLVVEDEILIAMLIEDAINDIGCEIVGPIASLDEAMTMARDEAIDAAFLDVNIRGGEVYPVADILLRRGIPFVFSSGYGDWALPPQFQGQRRLTKPFTGGELEAMVRALCDAASRGVPA